MVIDDYLIKSSDDLALPWLAKYASFVQSDRNFFDSCARTYEYTGVLLDGKTGIVANMDGTLVPKGLDEVFYWLPSCIPGEVFKDSNKLQGEIDSRQHLHSIRAREIMQKAEVDGAHILADRNIYLTHPFGWYPYGHLLDSLQRLFSLDSVEKDATDTFYLVSNHSRVRDFADHFQALSGATYGRTKQIDTTKIYYCESLCIPVSPAVPTTFTIESYNWLIELYLRYFGLLSASSEERETSTRLYLSRNHVVPGKRSVINEAELIQRLTSDYGFTIVTGNESLRDIVFLFSSASFITGAHGSLFANSIFCRRKCSAVEFCPSNRIDRSFEYKIKAIQNYEHILVDADSDHNIEIQLEEILKRLNP